MMLTKTIIFSLLWSFSVAYAERTEVPVIDATPQTVGVRRSPEIAVPGGSNRVGVYINRAAFMNPQAEVGVTIEALVGAEWRVIKAPQNRTKGGIRTAGTRTQTESSMFVTVPAGATHVRIDVNVVGRPAVIPTKVVFE